MWKDDGRIRAMLQRNALDTQAILGVCEHKEQQFVPDGDR